MAKQDGRGQARVHTGLKRGRVQQYHSVSLLHVLFAQLVVGPTVGNAAARPSATSDKMGNLPNSMSQLYGDHR